MPRRSRQTSSALAQHTITLDGIDVDVTRKRIRHLHIRVHGPEGRVRVSAPAGMRLDDVERVIAGRLPWIRSQRDRLRQAPRAPERTLTSGETHALWGEPYALHVSSAGRARVELREGTLWLTAPEGADVAARQRILDRWYREQIEVALPALLETWVPVIGERVKSVTLRRMTTRWGSCTPARRTIRLNIELATRHPRCLEYVLVHELVHLLERSHNARFYALMDRFLPGWRAIRHELNHGSRTTDSEVD